MVDLGAEKPREGSARSGLGGKVEGAAVMLTEIGNPSVKQQTEEFDTFETPVLRPPRLPWRGEPSRLLVPVIEGIL